MSAASELEGILRDQGLRGALKWLNARTPFRYTALYVREDGLLKNIYVFDRADPQTKPFASEPVEDTYCSLVFGADASVAIDNTQFDKRAIGHVKEASVRSYCGVPLRRANGKTYGTICHFDNSPQEMTIKHLVDLEQASGAISVAIQQVSGDALL